MQLREKLQEDEDGWKMLLCQLEAAELCRENYQRQEIGEEIFVDTMRCFSRFIRECYEMSGRFAFDRGWWTWRQLCMSLFRLGDLECELCTGEGERVISLHIPSDADLLPAAVDRSLGQIGSFVQRYFPQWAAAPMAAVACVAADVKPIFQHSCVCRAVYHQGIPQSGQGIFPLAVCCRYQYAA